MMLAFVVTSAVPHTTRVASILDQSPATTEPAVVISFQITVGSGAGSSVATQLERAILEPPSEFIWATL